jgi:hypothetical protein
MTFRMMQSALAPALLAGLAALAPPAPASAQLLPGAWQFGTVNQRDSRQYMASLRSANLLPGGVSGEGYAAIFSLACTEGDPQHWQQQLVLEEPLTSRGVISIGVKIDGRRGFGEQWVVTGEKRIATKVGAAEIARLAGAKRLKLSWNWGWSWLWLSDEATFELGDARTVIFTLAKSCSLPMPRQG